MSTTGRDRSIEEQLSALLDYNAPAVTVEEVRENPPATTPAEPSENRRRVVGLRPALAWMLGLLVLCGLGLGIGVGVSGSTAKKPVSVAATGRLSDHLVLDKTRVVAGQTVDGNVVIYNPGKAFVVEVCSPPVQVLLNRGNFHQEPVNDLMFCDDRLRVLHGTTRLPFTVTTTVDSCIQSGPSQPPIPMCLTDGEPPPLPTGTYLAKVEWGKPMPLPTPGEVALTLVATTDKSVGSPPVAPSRLTICTSQELATSVLGGQGATEQWVIPIWFKNVSKARCVVDGYPEVRYLGKGFQPIGRAAVPDPTSTAARVVLNPGETVGTTLWSWEAEVLISFHEPCGPATAVGLQVMPPGSSTYIDEPAPKSGWQGQVCTSVAPRVEPVMSLSG